MSFTKKYFLECGYNLTTLLFLTIIVTFFSPVFPSYIMDAFLDIWILLASYLVLGFLIKLIVSILYNDFKKILPFSPKTHQYITGLSNIIFYLALAAAYYIQIFVIIYYRVIGDTPMHMFHFIKGDGWNSFLINMSITKLQSYFIILGLLIIYIVIWLLLMGDRWILKKRKNKKLKYMLYIAPVMSIISVIITVSAFTHFRGIFTNPKSHYRITQQLSWFSVVNISIFKDMQTDWIRDTLTPLQKEYLKKWFVLIHKDDHANYDPRNKNGWTGSFVPHSNIPVPIVPEAKKKNIIYFVIDTTRYDLFQRVMEQDPWLKKYVHANSEFKNHYAPANISLDSVIEILTGFPNYSRIQPESDVQIFEYYWKYFQLNRGWSSGTDKVDLTKHKVAHPILVRTIVANYDKSRQILGGVECITYAIVPPLWCKNTERLQNKKGYFLDVWQTTAALINMIAEDPNKPFFAYIQPQTVHSNGTFNLSFPFAHVVRGRPFGKEESLKSAQDSIEVSVLAFKYIVEQLKAKGLYDNTIIILTSDHGELYGEYGLIGHGNVFNKTMLHVPFVIHWPGKPAKVYTHRTSHYDIVPTLMKNYFEYSGDLTKIGIGKDLFDTKKQWDFLPATSWGGRVLWMPNGTCFRWWGDTIMGCNPASKATGLTKKNLKKMLYYLTLQAHGFAKIP